MHVIQKFLKATLIVDRLTPKSTGSCIIRKLNRTTKTSVTMNSYFKGHGDRYNGITIDSNEEPCESQVFASRLDGSERSLQEWIKNKKRTIWFKVHTAHSEWVPALTKHGFKFHHAKEEYVMMYRWLPIDEESNIPPYAHTNLGVGAFVFNEKTNEVLVIKEKYSPVKPMWKLPGGYVEPGENIEDAAKREVMEETGIEAVFKCLVAFRHGHHYSFGCSDIYMIAYMVPCSSDIQKCNREIAECKWMKLDEYVNHPDVHENNREFARKMYNFFQHQMGIVVNHAIHPITKKPIYVYSTSRTELGLPEFEK